MDMNAFLGYFQLAALAVFLLVFVGRSVYLRFGRNINPIALGVGKRGLRRMVELGFLVIFALWVTEILATALALDRRISPPPLQRRLLDSLSSQIAGVALVTAGGAIFILALVSFGGAFAPPLPTQRSRGQRGRSPGVTFATLGQGTLIERI